MSVDERNPSSSCQTQDSNAQEGSLDHVLSVLALHNHPFILIGPTAQRWMGAAGNLTNIANEASSWCPRAECDADIVLARHTVSNENEFKSLCLWTESTYHLSVDASDKVEVPDVYPWQPMLIESAWHPALHRTDAWWFGPHLHPDMHRTHAHVPQSAAAPRLFFHGLPRGRSAGHVQKTFVPSLGPYLDALVYHKRFYQDSKPGLAAESAVQIKNLTRYLYLELEGQRNALCMVMEEEGFMDAYLAEYKRKPFFVYRRKKGREGQDVLEATEVRKWDPCSYPDWCREKTKNC